MQEQLLHFIWQQRLFDLQDLCTTKSQPIEIIHQGIPNHDQGPDFLQARIRIDDQLWAGHVEIHVLSSAWFLHMHEKDPHYSNVILHVVWQEDEPAVTMNGIRIPCLELHNRINKDLLERYKRLMNNREWVPCASAIGTVDDLVKSLWLDRLMSERLEQKTKKIYEIYSNCGNDFEQSFFVFLARQLGAPANSGAMEKLGYKTPLNILRKHGDRIDQIESILFGIAGMLAKEISDSYPLQLKREFDFLKIKYGLKEIASLEWKFMRMRPAHFPTVRIAQLATLVSNTHNFIALLTEIDDADTWIKKLMVKPYHAYWDHHYHFRAASTYSEKHLGKDTAQSLVINVIVPFMFFYGKMQGLDTLKENALKMLCQLSPEKNAVIKKWGEHHWPAQDAGQTQALLQLKKHYCDQRRCLHCAIGLRMLK